MTLHASSPCKEKLDLGTFPNELAECLKVHVESISNWSSLSVEGKEDAIQNEVNMAIDYTNYQTKTFDILLISSYLMIFSSFINLYVIRQIRNNQNHD